MRYDIVIATGIPPRAIRNHFPSEVVVEGDEGGMSMWVHGFENVAFGSSYGDCRCLHCEFGFDFVIFVFAITTLVHRKSMENVIAAGQVLMLFLSRWTLRISARE